MTYASTGPGVGHNSGSDLPEQDVEQCATDSADPGPDLAWRFDTKAFHVEEGALVAGSTVAAFERAIQQQGNKRTRFRAIDEARWRWRRELTGNQFKLYTVICDFAKMTMGPSEPRAALMSLGRIAKICGATDHSEASRAVAELERVGAIACIRWMEGKRRRGYFTPTVVAADRTGETSRSIIAASEGADEDIRLAEAARKRKQRQSVVPGETPGTNLSQGKSRDMGLSQGKSQDNADLSQGKSRDCPREKRTLVSSFPVSPEVFVSSEVKGRADARPAAATLPMKTDGRITVPGELFDAGEVVGIHGVELPGVIRDAIRGGRSPAKAKHLAEVIGKVLGAGISAERIVEAISQAVAKAPSDAPSVILGTAATFVTNLPRFAARDAAMSAPGSATASSVIRFTADLDRQVKLGGDQKSGDWLTRATVNAILDEIGADVGLVDFDAVKGRCLDAAELRAALRTLAAARRPKPKVDTSAWRDRLGLSEPDAQILVERAAVRLAVVHKQHPNNNGGQFVSPFRTASAWIGWFADHEDELRAAAGPAWSRNELFHIAIMGDAALARTSDCWRAFWRIAETAGIPLDAAKQAKVSKYEVPWGPDFRCLAVMASFDLPPAPAQPLSLPDREFRMTPDGLFAWQPRRERQHKPFMS